MPTDMTHQTTLCTQGHRACPCSKACAAPEHCAAWAPAASTSGYRPITSTRATVIHLAVIAAAVLALVFIVKTAAGA